jgi:hypothetical protein
MDIPICITMRIGRTPDDVVGAAHHRPGVESARCFELFVTDLEAFRIGTSC